MNVTAPTVEGVFKRAEFAKELARRSSCRTTLRSAAAEFMLRLPDALDDWHGIPGLDLYRAQAAHLAAHPDALTAPIRAEGLTALELACVGLIEDAAPSTVSPSCAPSGRGSTCRPIPAWPNNSTASPVR